MSRLKTIFILILAGLVVNTSAQYVVPRKMASLPSVLVESSGVEVNGSNKIFTHNDSGDLPRIFEIDTLGNLVRTITLSNVTATDFEDITQDIKGNYYVGDFGNNLNNRQNQRIYKFANPDLIHGDSVVPGIIYFIFPDQHLFPPPATEMNFDCEAMFHYRDSLYLFSKNRGTSTYCKEYRLPDKPGFYTAALVDSFDTHFWITGADISPSGKSMILMSNGGLWLFTDFHRTNFFKGFARQLTFENTQKEAVVFVSETEVYLTDERYLDFGGNLYDLDLSEFLVEDSIGTMSAQVYPNPSSGSVFVDICGSGYTSAEIDIYNVLGQKVAEKILEVTSGTACTTLSFLLQRRGMYFVWVRTDTGMEESIKVVNVF